MQKQSNSLAVTHEFSEIKYASKFPFRNDIITLNEATISKLHIHNAFEIGYCLNGHGIFVIEEKVFNFEQGDIFIINHLEMHRACHPDNSMSKWHFFMLDPLSLFADTIEKYDDTLDTTRFAGTNFSNQYKATRHPFLEKLVGSLTHESSLNKPFHDHFVKGIILSIMAYLSNYIRTDTAQLQQPQYRDYNSIQRLDKALQTIAINFSEKINIEDLAKQCCLSTVQFRRLFKKEMKKSPLEYILEYRIGMATAMLKSTDKPISNIASASGFATLSSFNRQFIARKGTSPSAFRKKNRINKY